MDKWPHLNINTHTAGPWYQSHRRDANEMYSTEIYDRDGATIAICDWYQVPTDNGIGTNREANAKLIALAPKMYEALVELSYLGNGKVLGNSDGNMIARRVLQLLDVQGEK